MMNYVTQYRNKYEQLLMMWYILQIAGDPLFQLFIDKEIHYFDSDTSTNKKIDPSSAIDITSKAFYLNERW